VATVFALPASALLEIESERRPWYQLRAERLPQFAVVVQESLPHLLALFRVTARRWLVGEVRRRAGYALGRFDTLHVPNAHVRERSFDTRHHLQSTAKDAADLETLRTALAAVQAHNRASAAFFRKADMAAQDATPDRPRPS
jgi:hypothetical protein